MLSELIALPRLMIVGAYRGFINGYSEWQEASYRERKWRTARCASCTKGFRSDEAIYETGKGYQHRDCHYGALRAVK
jgi:hypothetical protein